MTRMTLDDLVVPDTEVSAAAREVASTYLSPGLFNHSVRAYVWAAARGTVRGIPFDPELLYVASMLHDLGLTAAFDSHTVAFEEAGGHVASVFAAGAGWTARRRERLSEVIIRHMWLEVDASTDPEGHLLANSTATDVVGANLDDFDADFRREVLARHPRLDFSADFLACFQAQAARKPDSSAAGMVRVGLENLMADNPLDAVS
ncbi:cyanamide hydratase [Streptomyces sp. 150FB]|uniref:cyanamide hydratase n=1 Tax=Streptomyces sp. 150FB TaxID=1576605 RepID=UPI000B1628A5|nr:cyanamide hydratase [Streptomyces sp. 150FB]